MEVTIGLSCDSNARLKSTDSRFFFAINNKPLAEIQNKLSFIAEQHTMEHLYYKPSGKIPVKGIFISLITASVITVILSIIYIALQWFIPFIYLNFFIAAGLGFGVGGGIFIAIGAGKIRKYNL
jgi:hypothetical protein